jgi:hypothetical protein
MIDQEFFKNGSLESDDRNNSMVGIHVRTFF